ncbi:hypothetical protein [Actinomadura sp. DC4]|uniref:hypothetical protein n=1 Tax=Actinomadura sp. DC4 TaxID=3055069 RepID=UPI0025B0531A|nr:hypothetical protein [Actinomadura sp. DC4]MDN3359544.1 hypothetical protein [Actinomadura sp. DC4]
MTLGKESSDRYEAAMDRAGTIVRTLSGHRPSARDLGERVSDIDVVRILVAARLARGGEPGAESAEEFARSLLSAVAASAPSRWAGNMTHLVDHALTRDYGRRARRFDHRRIVAAYYRLPDWKRRDVMPNVAEAVAQQLMTGGPAVVPGGALGAEFETVIRLTASKEKLPYRAVLADNERLGYKLVVDHRKFWVDTEGTYHLTRASFEASGKQLKETLFHTPIIEFVTRPGAVPGENKQWTIQQLTQSVSSAIHLLAEKAKDGPVAIDHWLTEDGWVHHLHDPGDVKVDVLPFFAGPGEELALFAQYTADIAPAELYGTLQDVLANGRPGTNAARFLAQGLEFGTEIARRYAGRVVGTPVPALAVDVLDEMESVAAVRGFMALVYPHIAAGFMKHVADNYVKNWVLAASRTAFTALRGTLPKGAQIFLEENAQAIADTLQDFFLAGSPDFVQALENAGNGLHKNNLFGLTLATSRPAAIIADYLENALLAEPGKIIDQNEGLGIFTHFMTANGGQAVVEFRGWGPYPIGISQVPDVIEPLSGMLADRAGRAREKHERYNAPNQRRTARLLRAVRLLSDPEIDAEAAAFDELHRRLESLKPVWNLRHAEPELFPAADVTAVLLGLDAVGREDPAAEEAMTEAVDALSRLRTRVELVLDADPDARHAIEAVTALLSGAVPERSLFAFDEFPEWVEGARRVLAPLPDKDDLLAQAGVIIGFDHEPLPADLGSVPAHRRKMQHGILQTVAADLHTAGEDSARITSSDLADALGTRRRSVGTPAEIGGSSLAVATPQVREQTELPPGNNREVHRLRTTTDSDGVVWGSSSLSQGDCVSVAAVRSGGRTRDHSA